MYGTYDRLRTNQNAYINLTQVNESSEYNIIIPKQKKEKKGNKGKKLYLTMKHLMTCG